MGRKGESIFKRKDGRYEARYIKNYIGDYAKYGGDYIKIIDWMVSVGFSCPIRLHTGNPVGRANMLRTMDRYGIPEYKYEFDEMF